MLVLARPLELIGPTCSFFRGENRGPERVRDSSKASQQVQCRARDTYDHFTLAHQHPHHRGGTHLSLQTGRWIKTEGDKEKAPGLMALKDRERALAMARCAPSALGKGGRLGVARTGLSLQHELGCLMAQTSSGQGKQGLASQGGGWLSSGRGGTAQVQAPAQPAASDSRVPSLAPGWIKVQGESYDSLRGSWLNRKKLLYHLNNSKEGVPRVGFHLPTYQPGRES